jgi:hypothetical protein
MATRASIVLAIALVGSACLATAGADVTLQSQRRAITVSVTPPAGWAGPAYQAWPSYDSFSFSRGNEPDVCYLQVRFDPYTDEPGDRHSAQDIVIHWNSTPLDKIREQYKREFQNPRVERLSTIKVAGESVRVYAVYNADGDYCTAEILRAGTVVLFELRCPRGKLPPHRSAFFSFLRSLRFT